LEEALKQFDRAINKGKILHSSNQLPYCAIDRDLYRNCGLCYARQATKYCEKQTKTVNNVNISYIHNTKQSLTCYQESCKMYCEALKLTNIIYGNSSLEYMKSLYEFGEIKALQGDIDNARKIFQHVQKIFLRFDKNTKQKEKKFYSNVQNMLASLQFHAPN